MILFHQHAFAKLLNKKYTYLLRYYNIFRKRCIVCNTRKYLITKTSVIRYGTNLSLKVYAKQHSNSSLKFYQKLLPETWA